MSNNTGGPAFPVPMFSIGHAKYEAQQQGLTLRDYFAAKAMQEMFANPNLVFKGTFREENFEMAYTAADMMLKAREQ